MPFITGVDRSGREFIEWVDWTDEQVQMHRNLQHDARERANDQLVRKYAAQGKYDGLPTAPDGGVDWDINL